MSTTTRGASRFAHRRSAGANVADLPCGPLVLAALCLCMSAGCESDDSGSSVSKPTMVETRMVDRPTSMPTYSKPETTKPVTVKPQTSKPVTTKPDVKK